MRRAVYVAFSHLSCSTTQRDTFLAVLVVRRAPSSIPGMPAPRASPYVASQVASLPFFAGRALFAISLLRSFSLLHCARRQCSAVCPAAARLTRVHHCNFFLALRSLSRRETEQSNSLDGRARPFVGTHNSAERGEVDARHFAQDECGAANRDGTFTARARRASHVDNDSQSHK